VGSDHVLVNVPADAHPFLVAAPLTVGVAPVEVCSPLQGMVATVLELLDGRRDWGGPLQQSRLHVVFSLYEVPLRQAFLERLRIHYNNLLLMEEPTNFQSIYQAIESDP